MMRSKPTSETRAERRRKGTAPRRPRPAIPADAGARAAADAGAAIEAALERVLSDGEWAQAALSEDEARRLADALAACCTGSLETGRTTDAAGTERDAEAGAGGRQTDYDGAERELIGRLIELTRAELLSGGEALGDADLVQAFRALEQARVRFEPEWHQAMASSLTGASALDLVVELAHDLRSPLTSIMFLSETLRKGQSGEINEVQRKQLGIVYSAALGLVSIASDVIDLAREREFEQDIAPPAPFSLAELLESVRIMVGPMAEEKKLDLTFLTLDHDVRIGQAVPLGRALLNLTTNALKFTERGGVEIVATETKRQRVRFSVRDTGRGIDTEALKAMFEPFRRSRSSTGFHFSGTGLGLAISRRMVELLGGQLKVESEVDAGTRFFFEIELPRGSRI